MLIVGGLEGGDALFWELGASLLECGSKGERAHLCVCRLGCPLQRGWSVLSGSGGILWGLLAAVGAWGLGYLWVGVLVVQGAVGKRTWGWEREKKGEEGEKLVLFAGAFRMKGFFLGGGSSMEVTGNVVGLSGR